ncbi:MAG: sigma-70 family RNA polymerase sigma factor [Planctomycetota bacterium]
MGEDAKAAFRELAQLWMKAQPALTLFVSATVRDSHAVEDIHQEVAKVVVEQYGKYDCSRPFTPWVIGIARVLVAKHLRVSYRQPFVLQEDVLEGLAEELPKVEPELEKRKHALKQCIEGLKGTAKRVIQLRYLSELGIAAVAAEVGMTQSSARVALHRARGNLAECIKRRLSADR